MLFDHVKVSAFSWSFLSQVFHLLLCIVTLFLFKRLELALGAYSSNFYLKRILAYNAHLNETEYQVSQTLLEPFYCLLLSFVAIC